jgi:hypothetical protein
MIADNLSFLGNFQMKILSNPTVSGNSAAHNNQEILVRREYLLNL